jgi:Domain of Unknown Function (DUF1259)
MRTTQLMFAATAAAALAATWTIPANAETDWTKIDLVFGRPAAVSGAVHRYGLPRTDLKVSLDGVPIKPGFALGGWVAFEPMGNTTMMMGDLVLTEAEINPVMTKLLASKSQPCTITCFAPIRRRSTCMWPGRATLNNLPE